jgi:hypothetical protein
VTKRKRSREVLTDRLMKYDGMRKKFKIAHLAFWRAQIKSNYDITIKPLAKNFNEKINLDFEQGIFLKKMIELYEEDCGDFCERKREKTRIATNLEALEKLTPMRKDSFFNTTYFQNIINFLEHKDFQTHLNKVERKNGKIYIEHYTMVCREYVGYVLNTLANKKRSI